MENQAQSSQWQAGAICSSHFHRQDTNEVCRVRDETAAATAAGLRVHTSHHSLRLLAADQAPEGTVGLHSAALAAGPVVSSVIL